MVLCVKMVSIENDTGRNFMYTYSLVQWILFFYIYCFFGWCFESAYVSLKEHHFVNRGFLRLPMLPIYGSGALAILIVTIPVKTYIGLVYVAGMISATLLELVTGAAMEAIFKVRYWDYSNQRFNYKGHICLSSSIAWGFLSILLTEVIHTPVERLVLGMNVAVKWTLFAIVSVLFVSDLFVSVKTAWDMRKLLERMEKLKETAEELEQKLAQSLAEQKEKLAESVAEQKEKLAESVAEQRERLTESLEERREKISDIAASASQQREKLAESVAEQKERLAESVAEQKERLAESVAEQKERLAESVAEQKVRIDKLWEERRMHLDRAGYLMRSQLKGNPGAVSRRFGASLDALKEKAALKRGHDKDERN